MFSSLSDWRYLLGILFAMLGIQALVLHLFGQPLMNPHHALMLWAGDINSADNSQQLTDWYSFSHIIHGFLFYCLLHYLFPKLSVFQRLLLAAAIEIGWEITENTPWLINQYRGQALSQDYAGDSIINSVSDTFAMMSGFIFAWLAPVWATISAGIGLELFVGYSIHDNLTLNVLGFFWRPEFIQNWQAKG